MAIFKNLIVNGSSRFLNTAYFQDVQISGTASFESISASGDITAGGNLKSTTGNLYLKNLLAINGQSDSWLRINANKAFSSGVYFGSSLVRVDGNFEIGGSGSNLNIIYNSDPTKGSFTVGTPATFNGTTTTISNLAASTATINNATITGDLTVGGVLQANDFIKNIVKAVGGQLYVSPTFQALSSTTVTCTAVTATQLSLTLSDNAINGTDYAGATWYKDSKVMLSGTITANTTGHTEEIIFSSVTGVVTANMSNSNKLQIKLDYDKASTYFKTGTLTTSDVAVMMYQINIPSGSANAGLHPIGIYIKAYGTDNKNSYIDIFGGTSNTPNARLGLLTGLSAMQNGTTPSGWGIATTNGFFDGTIVSSSGKIGAFTLSNDLRSGTWGTSGSVLVAGGYAPTTADAKSIGGSPVTGNTWAFTAGDAFGVTTDGTLYANNANITGTITATDGSFTGTVNANDGSFNGAITAQSGTIGGYTIVQGDTAGTTETTANDGHVYQTGLYVHSSDGTYEYETGIRGSSTDDEDEAFYVRKIAQDGTWDSSTPTFYVKNNGYLYANNANITGAITATSGSFNGNITAQGGTIGGFNIKKGDGDCAAKTSANGGHAYPNSLYVHNADNKYEYETGIKGETSSSNPNTLAFYITRITKGGNWQYPSNGGTRTDIFKIGHGGTLYCSNADITGKVKATSFSAQYNGNSSNVLATLTATYLSVANSSYSTLIGASGVTANVLSSGGGSVYTRFCRLTANLGFETYNNSAWGTFYGNSVDVAYDGQRQGRFTSSSGGNIGLYDVDNSNWIIYSNTSFEVCVPRVFKNVNAFDTTLRSPVGSSNVAKQGVSWLGGTATSTLSIRAQWNASSPATKTVAVASSDIRLKKDIVDSQVDALEIINRVKVREFTWKDDGVRQKIGVVVDELEELDPLLSVGGGEDENGEPIYKSVNNLLMISYLTKAVQQLSAQVDSLQNEIKELKGDK